MIWPRANDLNAHDRKANDRKAIPKHRWLAITEQELRGGLDTMAKKYMLPMLRAQLEDGDLNSDDKTTLRHNLERLRHTMNEGPTSCH